MSVVRRSSFPIVCVMAIALALNNSAAQDVVEPQWAVKESFALGTEKELPGRYPVVTFIPRSLLLYNVDLVEPDMKAGPQYAAATTQDGVRVFLLEDTISKGTFKPVSGERFLIFNTARGVCEVPNCDTNDEDDLLPVSAGERFRAEDQGGGLWKLTGNRDGEEIIGFISESRIGDLEAEAVVTDAARKLPRLTVAREKPLLPSLDCGETKKVGDTVKMETVDSEGADAISPAERTVFELFDLGTIAEAGGEYTVTFKKAYGDENQAHEFRVYSVTDNELSKTAMFAAQLVLECGGTAPAWSRDLIKSVTMFDDSPTRYDFSSFGAKPGLTQFTGAPYLWSVNNERQYRDLMAKLSGILGNRALAGFFLSEFNRSCRGSDRQKKECQEIEYPR